jgi:hypothetical protein
VAVPGDDLSYAEFGRAFFEHAVTEERILRAVAGIAGDPISFGPLGAGPGRFAKVAAAGEVGEARVRRLAGELVAFRMTVPVSLRLTVDLGVDQHEFRAKLEIGLTLTARAAAPLRVVIDVSPPSSRDVKVDVEASTRRATVLQILAHVDQEIGRFVARYVARELDKPHIREARDIDVAARIDGAWQDR